ncbi:acetolactate synthase large subunit [Pigmentiphaga soli]|uniref:Acetolactate synthase large subunit n=1 Tax=Pigmentiphaga soli TaxID=1007095 RepID=A0ABP8H5P6_9BURK
MDSPTALDAFAARLAERGVKRFFGVPGGDCSLDLIDACARAGIDFILTRAESAAAMMASVTAELTGAPGVVMTTRGPGLAHALNGVAYATLDRAPLLVLADGYDKNIDHVSHQRFDQEAVVAPLVRASGRLVGTDGGRELDRLIDATFSVPPGPVYVEMRGSEIRAKVEPAKGPAPAAKPAAPAPEIPEKLRILLGKARKPIIIAGLQASDKDAARALRQLVDRWNCPVLQTYKSHGSVPSSDPRAVGFYIGGVAEEPVIKEADLIVLYGLDAIEFPPHRWRYDAPIVELTTHAFSRNIVSPEVSLVGPLPQLAEAVSGLAGPGDWTDDFFARTRVELRRKADASAGSPISPQMVADAVKAAAPKNTRITLDAGAHMLPAVHTWDSDEPRQTLISRGLATMAFAIPAAIASALAEPDRPVVAFTGDGGVMMCGGELGTAAQYGCKMVTVVFNDSSLTLISAKQQQRGLQNAGVDFSGANFAKVAEGFGCLGIRVEKPEELAPAMQRAFAHDGPALVDVVVDPAAYKPQLASLRG